MDISYLGRRLERAEAASDFVVLLVLEFRSAFEAFEATLLEVLTEFLDICSHLLSGIYCNR